MKFVRYQEFLLLPPGTVYSNFNPCVVEGLYRKGYTLIGYKGAPCDFMYVDLLGDVEPEGAASYTARPPGDWGRDGLYDFDGNRVLLVYEPADVEKLVGLLKGEKHEADG